MGTGRRRRAAFDARSRAAAWLFDAQAHGAMAARSSLGRLTLANLLIIGWGTWIRTKIDGVRVRSSTVELSPTGAPSRSDRAIECFV